MAFVAGDARRRVLRVGKRFLLLARNVAGQAAFRVFLGTGVEREDQLGAGHFLGRVARRILFGLRMGFAGAMAGLTSGNAGGRRSGRGLCPCRRLPFQRHQVIHEIVDFLVGHVGRQRGHNGAGAALRPSVRAIPRACGAPRHHRELPRPRRLGRQSCGSPRTSCRHRSSFPPQPRRTFPAWGWREKWAMPRPRSVRSLHKRLGFGAMAARTGLPAGIVAGLPDKGSLRRHRGPVGRLRHPLRKGLARERAKGEHQRHEHEQRSEFAFRLGIHRALSSLARCALPQSAPISLFNPLLMNNGHLEDPIPRIRQEGEVKAPSVGGFTSLPSPV